MAKSNHKYRVSIYLGKEIYEHLEKFSKVVDCSVNTLSRHLFVEGLETSMPALEKMFEDAEDMKPNLERAFEDVEQ